jgi:putative PIN family toxin of toxin-antitoxin system
MRLIIDTNVFIGACLTAGASNLVLAACLKEQHQPIMGNSFFSEYEDVLARTSLFEKSRLSKAEREELFDIFVSRCEWIRVYYQWRPNLRDHPDSHLIELAVAGNAHGIVTRNTRDLESGQLLFPHILLLTPEQFLKDYSS